MKTRIIQLAFMATLALLITSCKTPKSGGNAGSGQSDNSVVNFDGACEQRDEVGYYDNIRLKVVNNQVQELRWTANPRKGRCTFDLAKFTQTATQPQATLQSKVNRKCQLFIWRNKEYITVSSYNCKSVCAVNDSVLPVLLNPQTGGCSQKSPN